jgi:hypothetical protein
LGEVLPPRLSHSKRTRAVTCGERDGRATHRARRACARSGGTRAIDLMGSVVAHVGSSIGVRGLIARTGDPRRTLRAVAHRAAGAASWSCVLRVGVRVSDCRVAWRDQRSTDVRAGAAADGHESARCDADHSAARIVKQTHERPSVRQRSPLAEWA